MNLICHLCLWIILAYIDQARSHIQSTQGARVCVERVSSSLSPYPVVKTTDRQVQLPFASQREGLKHDHAASSLQNGQELKKHSLKTNNMHRVRPAKPVRRPARS